MEVYLFFNGGPPIHCISLET